MNYITSFKFKKFCLVLVRHFYFREFTTSYSVKVLEKSIKYLGLKFKDELIQKYN